MCVAMKKKFIHNTPLGRFLRNLIGSLILALIVAAFSYNYSAINLKVFLITYGWAFAVCYTQWIGHTYLFNLLDKRISWEKQPIRPWNGRHIRLWMIPLLNKRKPV